MMQNMYDALYRAQSSMMTEMGTFSSTFAPVPDKNMMLKVFLDVIGLGFALLSAPAWNSRK